MEASVADEIKPRAVVGSGAADHPPEVSKQKPLGFVPGRMRTTQELQSLADQIEQNEQLMKRIKASLGSGDELLGWQVMDELTKFAQSIDPSIIPAEGTRLMVIILRRLKHF